MKIVIPTKNFEYEPIIRQWFEPFDVEVIIEKGAPPSGWDVRQKYTELFSNLNEFIVFMDDDTLIPYDVMRYALEHDGQDIILMFGQIWWCSGPKRLEPKPINCYPVRCDIGQVMVNGKLLTGYKWETCYENDGYYIQHLYNTYPQKFRFVPHLNTWYNALANGKGLFNGEVIQIA